MTNLILLLTKLYYYFSVKWMFVVLLKRVLRYVGGLPVAQYWTVRIQPSRIFC